MPLHEAIEPTRQAAVETVLNPPAEPERARQGLEYTRRDGTVEYAANREEAIKLCPVLGKLAMNDPETANLLLDIASMGQAKMAEKDEPPKPATDRAHSTGEPKSSKPVEQVKTEREARVAHPTRTGTETMKESAQVQSSAEREPGIRRPADSEAQKPAKVAEQDKAVIPEVKNVFENVEHVEPGRGLQYEVAQPVEEIAAPIIAVQSQPDVARVANQAFAHQPLTGGQILKPAEVQPVRRKQSEPAATDAHDTALLYEQADLGLEPTIKPEIAELTDEQAIEPADYELADADKSPELVSSADELAEEPMENYEDFERSLQLLVALPAERPAPESEGVMVNTDEHEPAGADEAQEVEAVPDIAVTVSERLAELGPEDKEVAAAIVADIVQTVHSVEVLDTEEIAELETTKAVQVALEQRVDALFEKLGIEYQSDDVERFAAVLLRPDFQLPQPETVSEQIAVDLERDGTHEAKTHFVSTTAGLVADVENSLKRFLGTLVLFSPSV